MFLNAPRYDSYLEDVRIPAPDNLVSPPDGSVGSRGFGSGLGPRAPWGLGRKLGMPEDLDERAYIEACYQAYLKRYLRCVKGIDDNIKRLVDYLEQSGELDNTLIIYTSDQGFFLGERDPSEMNNLYSDPAHQEIIERMKEQLREKREALGETDENFPAIQKIIDAN